jgi:hypothetical protein
LSHFELEDAPDYLAQFPVLKGKKELGRGEFSVVFEGCCPNTVLKLTVDTTTVTWLLGGRVKGCDGIVEFVEYHGQMKSSEHPDGVHLIELKRLQEIHPCDHRPLYYERDSIIATIRHRMLESDRFEGIIPAQERYAGAIQELALSNLFSQSISKALTWIADFMKTSQLDLLHDLCNPANYMTDGRRLIITDPLVTVPAD